MRNLGLLAEGPSLPKVLPAPTPRPLLTHTVVAPELRPYSLAGASLSRPATRGEMLSNILILYTKLHSENIFYNSQNFDIQNSEIFKFKALASNLFSGFELN